MKSTQPTCTNTRAPWELLGVSLCGDKPPWDTPGRAGLPKLLLNEEVTTQNATVDTPGSCAECTATGGGGAGTRHADKHAEQGGDEIVQLNKGPGVSCWTARLLAHPPPLDGSYEVQKHSGVSVSTVRCTLTHRIIHRAGFFPRLLVSANVSGS